MWHGNSWCNYKIQNKSLHMGTDHFHSGGMWLGFYVGQEFLRKIFIYITAATEINISFENPPSQ